MNLFAIIASLLNKIFSFSLPGISMSGPSSGTSYHDTEQQQGDTQQHHNDSSGERKPITIPEHINPNARFHSTGSPAWVNQFPNTPMAGQHGGTDFLAPPGSPVFAPYDMHVIAVGHYSDSGRFGDYVIGNWKNGLEYYSGHLQNVSVSVGDDVKAGQQIGETNLLAHTHIQVKQGGQVIDPESVLK
jgi:murein DD-endopeptidase MepM/ murein hydrolase activator NlpD